MYEIYKEFRFEAAHSLPHLPDGHKCRNPHGHSYRVTVYVRGEVNQDTGFVVDYADISAAWRPLYDQLDHRDLNIVEGLRPSTSEQLSRWIYERLKASLPGLDRVTVGETATAGCTYRSPRE